MKLKHSYRVATVLTLGMAVGILAAAETSKSLIGQGNAGQGDTPPDGRGNFIRGAAPKNAAGLTVGTGNGINYHNGPVLHTVNLYYIYYGNWNQPSLNSTGTTYLDLFAKSIGGTPYFNINSTYGDTTGATVPNAVTYKGAYVDSGSLGTSLSDASIATVVSNAINSTQWGAPGVADPNGLYLVLTAPGVAETSGFISKYCGWHSWGTWGAGTPVQYGFVGNAAGSKLGNCADQTTVSPNGDPGVDAMISVIAHELSETVSDPQGNAWYDSAGNENGDKCAWNFGTTSKLGNGALYNVTMGGSNYLIQQIWLNAQGGLCAMSYTSTPDFSVSVSSSQTVSQGSTSGAYTVTATALNQFNLTNTPVSWSFGTLPAGITAGANSLTTKNTASFTLIASASIAPGTYSIPIIGTSGGLTHTVSATLVVSAPTYSLSINPGTAITRPTSGTTTATYTVNVTPMGNFTTPVKLSASLSGRTTGITVAITGTNPVTPGSTGTLSVTVTNSARAGQQTVTVTGSAAGTSTKQASTTITIQ